MKKVLGVLAVAGLASTAMAQSFDGRVDFRIGHDTVNTNNLPPGNIIEWNPGDSTTINMSLLLGAFDAQGVTNYGMYNWIGNITSVGGGVTIAPSEGSGSSAALRGPFTQNPVGQGTASPDGSAITGIDAARPITSASVSWPFGEPQPTNPPTFTQGNNAFFQTYRFVVNITDTSTPRDIVFTADGFMQIITGWTQTGANEPEDEETPGSVIWAGTGTLQDDSVTGTFTIRIVPAPGAAALLGLGGLVASRRRRA